MGQGENNASISGWKNLLSLYRPRLAVILFVVLFVAYLDRVNVSVLVVDPEFLRAMGITNDPVAKGMLMTAFLICYGVGNAVLSPIGDWLGPKKTTLISIFLWFCAMLVGGIAASFTVMIISRIFLGIGESLHFPMQSKYVKNWFPVNERGKANATWLVGTNVAPMIAIPLFAWMIPIFGWRENFYFLAALALLPFVLIWKYTADHPQEYKNVSVSERSYIESELAKEKESEKKSQHVSVWKSYIGVLRDYRVWLLVLAYSGTMSIWWGTVTWLPAYLKEARGFSWAEMGFGASLPYIMAILVKLFAGWAVDKFNKPEHLLGVGLFGSAVFIYLGAHAHGGIAAIMLITCGIGMLAIGTPAAWYLLQQIVPSNAIGSGSGFMVGVSSGIAALAPVLTGYLIALFGSYTGGLMYMVGWGLFGTLVCIILVLCRRE